MAIHTFYVSVEISKKEKKAIMEKIDLRNYKKSDDLVYKDVLFIENIDVHENVAESWWHINTGLYDFFHSCEMLYEICQAIEIVKPRFSFVLMGQKYEFDFSNLSLLDFIQFLYPKIEEKKKRFEECCGILSIDPNKFFSFKRKNRRFFN